MYQWELQRTPEQLINRAIQQPKRRSISDLNQEISHQSESEDHQTYRIIIQNRILSPAMYAAMALLALSLSLGAVRKTGMGPRLAVGLFIGLSFKYLQDFLIPMTLVFNLPPLIVAIVPVLICALVAFYLINRYASLVYSQCQLGNSELTFSGLPPVRQKSRHSFRRLLSSQ